MRYGASTFIWVSPFSNRTLDIIDRVKSIGFDLIEISVEDPETIDVAAIRSHAARAGVGVTICGAFGPGRDLSSEDEAIRDAGLAYLRRCIDYAQALGSPFVSGPMYAAVGNTRLLDEKARREQWRRAVDSLRLPRTGPNDPSGLRSSAQPVRDRPRQHGGPGPSAIDDIGADMSGAPDTFHMNIEEKDIRPPPSRVRPGISWQIRHAFSNDRGIARGRPSALAEDRRGVASRALRRTS